MENWFGDRGKAILLDAIEGVCDRIGDSFTTEYVESLANLNAELKTLRCKASQIDRLTEENVALKSEIAVLKEANRENTTVSDITSRNETGSTLGTPPASKSADRANSKRLSHADIDHLTVPELKAEFLRLDQTYAKLLNTCLDLQDALHQSNELVRERTTSCDQWVKHADQLREQSVKRAQKIKKLEAKLAEMSHDPLHLSLPLATGNSGAMTESTPTPSDISVSGIVANAQDQTNSSICVDGARKSMSPVLGHGSPELSRPASTVETNDSTRASDTEISLPPLLPTRKSTEENMVIKAEPSSDTPVVVSERSVRKRKYAGADYDNREALAKVKVEYSPVSRAAGSRRHLALHESIDFDIEGYRVQTPKKQTKHRRSHGPWTGDGVDDQNNDTMARFLDRIGTREPGSRHSTSDDESCETNLTSAHRPRSLPSSRFALKSLDNNQVLRKRLDSASNYKTRKSTMLQRGLASLAENECQGDKEVDLSSKNKANASVLARLLDTPSRVQNPVTALTHSPEQRPPSELRFQPQGSREASKRKDGNKRTPSNPSANTNSPSRDLRSVSTDRNQVRESATVTTTKNKGGTRARTLRQTPKANLRLDDFKINPHANEGCDYAFTDVVRGKDDRLCLQGCIKEDCCGHKFRGLAKACRASTSPFEFQAQLESYLGDECHRLATMSKAEKESLWVEAKMRELANASSKHRHRYPRMKTPPGFWRLDFPSTQENEEYNEEAAKLERDIVEERYREAMRPGGLWVFRDE